MGLLRRVRNGLRGLRVALLQRNGAKLHHHRLQAGRALRHKPLQQAGRLFVLAPGAVDGSADKHGVERGLRQLAQKRFGAGDVLLLNAAVD